MHTLGTLQPREIKKRPGHWLLLAAVALGNATAALNACSSKETPPPEENECERGCPETSGQDLSSPPVSFADDVFPIFEKNCSDVLCHGSDEAPRAELYLGPAEGASADDIDEVYANLEGTSTTAPSMKLLSAGDPARSFLMIKVDGCQNSLGLTCDAEPNLCRADCGDPMPPLPRDTYSPLTEAEKLTLRRWIAQGAQR